MKRSGHISRSAICPRPGRDLRVILHCQRSLIGTGISTVTSLRPFDLWKTAISAFQRRYNTRDQSDSLKPFLHCVFRIQFVSWKIDLDHHSVTANYRKSYQEKHVMTFYNKVKVNSYISLPSYNLYPIYEFKQAN